MKSVNRDKSTIKDIVNFTGLSLGTISKFINGGRVKPKNEEKIKEAIKALDFRVNEFARGLKTNRSKVVGIIIPSMENFFCTSLVSNIETELSKFGYSVMICTYQEKGTFERERIEFLIGKKVDAIVLVPTCEIETVMLVEQLVQSGEIIISIDRNLDNIECDAVTVDNYHISYKVTNYLIEKGHSKISIICGPKRISTAFERLRGYEKALKDNDILINKNYIRFGDYYTESGYKRAKELLTLSNPPTAIFGTNYDTTLGVIMAINELGKSIPEDVSVVGFDNLATAKAIKPSLTIVTQPMNKIAKETSKIIIERLSEKEDINTKKIHKILKADFVIGASVKHLNKE